MGHRSYGQYCPVAVALDVIGDRWTLLIMRELLTGDRRFTDLRAALPGIAPNLLADRLRDLQAAGLVEHKELPPPAARTVYTSSPAAAAVVPVLQALAQFGAPRLGPLGDARPRPTMAVFGLLAAFHRPEPPGSRFHVRLVLDGETLDLVTDGARLSTTPCGEAPDLTVRTTTGDLVSARRGARPLAVGADSPAARRFADLYQLS